MRYWSALAVSCLALIACGPPTPTGGGGGGGGGGGRTPSTPAQITSAYAGAVCDYMLRCNQTRTRAALLTSVGQPLLDRDECLSTLSGPGTDLDRIKDALDAERVTFNADSYQACILVISTASCNAPLNSSACDATLVGTVAVGGGCFIDEECQNGDNGEIGDCTAQSDQCGTCVLEPAPAELNEACDEQNCADGLVCTENVCVERPARTIVGAGDDCETEGQFDWTGTCDRSSDLLCVASVCTETQFSSEAGTRCGDNGTLCEGGLVCPLPLGETADVPTCRAPAAIGEACVLLEAMHVVACVSGAYCDTDNGQVCTTRKANGESCSDDDQCMSNSCEEDQCAESEEAPADPSWQACP